MSNIQGYSDKELKELTNSEAGERKKAVAAEILRRRREADFKAWGNKYPILAATLSTLKLVTLMRWVRR